MATEIQLRRSQWFYDDVGYYSYVLLNVPEDRLKKIQQILGDSGLQVSLTGKSYRPASNGIQYQWYIRVSDEKSERHPTRERVNGILAIYEAKEVKRVVPEAEIRKPTDNKVAAQKEEIKRLKVALNEKEREFQIAEQHLEYMRKQNQELQEYRQRNNHLESRLRQIQEKALRPEDVTQIRQDYESTTRALRQKLEDKEKELASWISNFEPLLQELKQKIVVLRNEIRDLQNQIAIVKKEKRKLVDRIQEMQATPEIKSKKKSPERSLHEIFSVLLPDIEFKRGSLDVLWNEIQNPGNVFRDLIKPPGQWGGKRVQNTQKWKEKHIEHNRRLYFRKCEDSKYQVLISHKNTQKEDIVWLSHQ